MSSTWQTWTTKLTRWSDMPFIGLPSLHFKMPSCILSDCPNTLPQNLVAPQEKHKIHQNCSHSSAPKSVTLLLIESRRAPKTYNRRRGLYSQTGSRKHASHLFAFEQNLRFRTRTAAVVNPTKHRTCNARTSTASSALAGVYSASVDDRYGCGSDRYPAIHRYDPVK